MVGSEMGKGVLSGLKWSGNAGLSMGLSIGTRGTRTGGRTEKKKFNFTILTYTCTECMARAYEDF